MPLAAEKHYRKNGEADGSNPYIRTSLPVTSEPQKVANN